MWFSCNCLPKYRNLSLSAYSWNDASESCKQSGMFLPSIKTMDDVNGIATSSDGECGLITFLGLRRNEEVRLAP